MNHYDGDFTFYRNDKKSAIDWCFGNRHSISSINGFKIVRDSPKISDHIPIVVEIEVSGEKSLDALINAAKELNEQLLNHTKIPKISSENTNLDLLDNLLKIDIDR